MTLTVFPMYVGVNRHPEGQPVKLCRIPHVCGGEPGSHLPPAGCIEDRANIVSHFLFQFLRNLSQHITRDVDLAPLYLPLGEFLSKNLLESW